MAIRGTARRSVPAAALAGLLALVAGCSNRPPDDPEAYVRKITAARVAKDADFNSSTDHVAEYGLAALVGGIAAKKLGLLAAAGVLFLKFWKQLADGAVVDGGGVVKFFRGRSKSV